MPGDYQAARRWPKQILTPEGRHYKARLGLRHIISHAVVPELDKVIANLELMPMRMNAGKSDKIGERQVDLGKKLLNAGLLSKEGWQAILSKQ
jgi:hypothetical protein